MTKIYTLLIHGTWAGAAKWTHPGSRFRGLLKEGLEELGYKEIRFETFPWNGVNRWRARYEVSRAVNDHLDAVVAERGRDWEFLVVAHSHGGNIATEAVRKRLQKNPDLPIRGVVCLNTPFLTHQLRGSNGFLLVWLVTALLLLLGLWFGGSSDPLAFEGRLGSMLRNLSVSLDHISLRVGLALIFVLVGGLFLGGRSIQRREQEFPWEPRPRVLCLSCPDDEALTFLGLGEGIANLPQLLVHPFSFLLFLVSAGFALFQDGLTWCGLEGSACWQGQISVVSVILVCWLAVALAGGVVGSFLVTLLFGLSMRQAFRALASRILVSYVPLRPSRSHFRGISDIPVKWNLLRLFHSGIYESSQTVEELCKWLDRYRRVGD